MKKEPEMQTAEEMAAAIEAEAMQSAKPEKRMVKLKLFKDNGMYKDPVFVAVNGHRFIVPRGVEVEVPEYIAAVLEESFRRDQATAEQLMTLERKFKEDSKKLD